MPHAEHAKGARRGPGRPRAAPKRHNGLSTRDEILAAASALFAARGYEATSTRQIADAAGVRQATLYYHFTDKQAILMSLLSSTVTPALALARWLDAADLTPEVRMCALVRYDVHTLLRDRLNLHVIYHLPGLVSHDFEPTRAAQASLRDTYRRFGRAVLDAMHRPDRADLLARDLDLVFALVEAAVPQRQWGGDESRSAYAASVVRGSLRLLGIEEARIPGIIASAAEALDAYPGAPGPKAP
ncbi:TetR/AcrR family transcriptional regulator [Streptomyces sp. PT12]|uniref:TetR/AcrR family transcriptional regulator n=1 Tax=Streptomyces sp. PT12 TaxID=1510197 RepID=UPI000DE50B02|nr:TetR/AcrR family transcriptional regulator [Streptomyces sp. PT12]RBM06259.1 TetR/AcrR family transcriptional regulator [Streptomyces sp. PT12]